MTPSAKNCCLRRFGIAGAAAVALSVLTLPLSPAKADWGDFGIGFSLPFVGAYAPAPYYYGYGYGYPAYSYAYPAYPYYPAYPAPAPGIYIGFGG